MLSRSGRWLSASLAAFACLLPAGVGLRAGGMFVIQSEADPKIIDITKDVRQACTQTAKKAISDEVVLQVLHVPGSEALAEAALAMMERVHGLMAGRLGLRLKSGARLYIVELERYPASFRIVDKLPHVVEFAAALRSRSDAEKLTRISDTVFTLLPHEWGHRALGERFGRRSPGERSRWIGDAFASYVEYAAVRELWPEGLDHNHRLRLAPFHLATSDLKSLVDWGFARRVPPREPIARSDVMYGASLGLFLRLEERGGPGAVLSFLDRLPARGSIGVAEVEAALQATVGVGFAALAQMAPDERQRAYEDTLSALGSGDVMKQSASLAMLGQFPERFASHGEILGSFVGDPKTREGIRARAAELAVDQGPDGTAASLLGRLQGGGGELPPARVELPLLLRLAKERPACALSGLARLAEGTDVIAARRASERIRELAGRKAMGPADVSRWVESRPFGPCETSDDSRGDSSQAGPPPTPDATLRQFLPS